MNPDRPACCGSPSWTPQLDLGQAAGFDYLLGTCDRCGAYSMNVFCVASGITGFEPVSASDAGRVQSLSGSELKAFLRAWGEKYL